MKQHIDDFIIFMYATSVFIFNYTGISSEWFSILAILMILDTIFWYTKIVAVWGKPTSVKLKSWVLGKIAVLCAPIVLSLLFKASGRGGDWMISTSLWLFIWAEWYSVIRNILATRTGKEIEEYDVITTVLTSILWAIKWVIEEKLFKR
jgi:hypothetical protein